MNAKVKSMITIMAMILLLVSCNHDQPEVPTIPEVVPVLGFTGNLSRSVSSRSLAIDMTSSSNYLATLVTNNNWTTLHTDRTMVEGVLGYFISFNPMLGGFADNADDVEVGKNVTGGYLGYTVDIVVSEVDGNIVFYADLPESGGYINIIFNPITRAINYKQTLFLSISYGTPFENYLHFEFDGTLTTSNEFHCAAKSGFIINDGTTMKVLQDYEFYSANDYQGFFMTGFLQKDLDAAVEISIANESTLVALAAAADTTTFTLYPVPMYIYMDKTGTTPVPVYGPNDDSPDNNALYRAASTPPWTLLP